MSAYLDAKLANRLAILPEDREQGRCELLEFGANGWVGHQQAPALVFHWASLYVGAQPWRQVGLNHLEHVL
jgi:hypothetical protein